jgi:hypothetical protein
LIMRMIAGRPHDRRMHPAERPARRAANSRDAKLRHPRPQRVTRAARLSSAERAQPPGARESAVRLTSGEP